MKIATVNIIGVIGSYSFMRDNEKSVQLVDVVAQMKGQDDAEKILLVIDSPGGDPDIAFEIVDYIQSFKKPIETLISGQCASAATIIQLCGVARLVIAGREYFVHNPSLLNVTGDADTLQFASEYIRESEDKMAKYYSKVTGIPVDGIYPLMKRETSLSDVEALKLGFVTKIITEEEAKALSVSISEKTAYQPIAFLSTKHKPLNQNDMSEIKSLKSSVDKILAHLKLKKSATADKKALDWKTTDANHLEVHFETEAEMPEVGTAVTIDGEAAPDGTYAFENGVSVTVKDGLVSAVSEPNEEGEGEGADSEAVATLKTEIEALKKENKKLKDVEEQSKKDFKELSDKVALISQAVIVGDVKLKKQGFVSNKGDEGNDDEPRNDYFAKKKQQMLERKKKAQAAN